MIMIMLCFEKSSFLSQNLVYCITKFNELKFPKITFPIPLVKDLSCISIFDKLGHFAGTKILKPKWFIPT